MNYQIVHAIDGRIRIRIPQLTEESFAQQLKSQIEQLKAVTSVRINPQAVSIVVMYRDRLITDSAMQEELHHIIEQLLPPEPPPIPQPPPVTVVTPPTAPSHAPAQTAVDLNLDEDVWADPGSEGAVQPPDPVDQIFDSKPPTVETPLPSEPELIDPVAVSEPLNSETPNGILDSLQQPVGCTPHSTALLAKRLGVSVQAINLRRSKPEFADWSRTRDPDGIAWTYQKASKVFVSVQTES